MHRRVYNIPQPNAPLSGLALYAKLGESSGNRADSYGTNTLLETGSVGNRAGKLGNAADFPGSAANYLSAADNITLDLGLAGSSFTICFWAMPDALGFSTFNRHLLMKRTGGSDYAYGIGFRGPNLASRWFFDVSYDGDYANGHYTQVRSDTFGGAQTGVWQWVCCELDNPSDLMYIAVNNGVRDSIANTADAFDSSAALNLGRDPQDLNLNYDGGLNQLLIYNRLLTSSEKDFIYNNGDGRDFI